MRYETVKIGDLKPSLYNPRIPVAKGSKEYEKIKASLTQHGVVEPLVVNANTMQVIGGHQRLTVMKDLGYTEVECAMLDIEDEAKEKTLNLALNNIKGEWDMEKLEAMLSDADVTAFETGFDDSEINFAGLLPEEAESGDDLKEELGDMDTDLNESLSDDEDENEEYNDADEGVEETNGVVYFSSFRWKIPVDKYRKLMADIRASGCFTKQDIVNEMIRRVTDD
jgi:ParB-like chromosome segregation protein Spo0J